MRENARKAALHVHPENLHLPWIAEIGLDQQYGLIGLRHGNRQVAGDHGLAVAGRRRRDQNGFGLPFLQAEVDGRPKGAERLGHLRPRPLGHHLARGGPPMSAAEVRQHAQHRQLEQDRHLVGRPKSMIEEVSQQGQAETEHQPSNQAQAQDGGPLRAGGLDSGLGDFQHADVQSAHVFRHVELLDPIVQNVAQPLGAPQGVLQCHVLRHFRIDLRRQLKLRLVAPPQILFLRLLKAVLGGVLLLHSSQVGVGKLGIHLARPFPQFFERLLELPHLRMPLAQPPAFHRHREFERMDLLQEELVAFDRALGHRRFDQPGPPFRVAAHLDQRVAFRFRLDQLDLGAGQLLRELGKTLRNHVAVFVFDRQIGVLLPKLLQRRAARIEFPVPILLLALQDLQHLDRRGSLLLGILRHVGVDHGVDHLGRFFWIGQLQRDADDVVLLAHRDFQPLLEKHRRIVGLPENFQTADRRRFHGRR